jgi:hypothetical protein
MNVRKEWMILSRIINVTVKIVSTKTGLSKNLFPPCPYSLEQLLDDDWYPKE